MTTTVFRKDGDNASIACDSRTSWVDQYGYIVKWIDNPKYKKAIMLDGVMYGFAGANCIFQLFLDLYSKSTNPKEESEAILDTLVEYSKNNKYQFMIIRYDEIGLKMFAYSPPNTLENAPELYKISKDSIIDTDTYAIGSGKESRMYLKHQGEKVPTVPIHKIISTNKLALTKKQFKLLVKRVSAGQHLLSAYESKQLHNACYLKGGDLFTGGVVNMCKSATMKEVLTQINIMERMDCQAKASGAVCASPINALHEKQNLEALGHKAISDHKVEIDDKKLQMMRYIESKLEASM